MPESITAARFVKELKRLSSPAEIAKVSRYFKTDPNARAKDNKVMGIGIGKVFPIAKAYMAMPLAEIEKLLESPFYEVRMGAVSIMDFQARAKGTGDSQRKSLFDLYLGRHDRINNWDLVDRAAPHVIGGYLRTKPRDVLYDLARSKNPWERRTAIVSTYYFLRSGEVADTFKIAELLLGEKHDLVQKATGSWLREAGKKDRRQLLGFLDKHAPRMPRPMLRYAVEHLEAALRQCYLSMGRVG